MKTKVKSVQQDGTWNAKQDNALMYRHEYAMEDGTIMQASHKTQMPFPVGAEVEYEVTRTHETYGKSGSVKKPNDFQKSGGYDVKGVEVGHAVNNAVNMICAGVELVDNELYRNKREQIIGYAEEILAISDELKSKR